MPLNAKRAGQVFGAAALLAVAIVAGFYSYARYRVRNAVRQLPAKLGVDVKQTTSGFTFSKSEGGRTLFTVSAGNAVQFKAGDHARLNDVRIIVYGRGQPANTGADQRRYDQIFGKEFDYDQKAGEVRAIGEVHIDLEATGTPDPLPQTEENHRDIGKLHLKTSGIVFNQKTAVAETDAPVEFVLPQASGSALGALYDSRAMALTLKSKVILNAADEGPAQVRGAKLTATNAVITDLPRQIDLKEVRMEQKARSTGKSFAADRANIYLREDSTVERMLATGNVRLGSSGAKGTTTAHSDRAEVSFSGANLMQEAVLTGNVHLDSTGASSMTGTTGAATVRFVGKGQIGSIRATGGVNFQEVPSADGAKNSQAIQLQAGGADFALDPRSNRLQSANTTGPSQITLGSTAQNGQPPTRTVVTAARFDATFVDGNHLRTLHGAPDARIVSSSPGKPDRVSTSRELNVLFDPARNGQVQSLGQQGDFHFTDAQHIATADSGHYSLSDETLVLTGNPRVQDKDSGLTVTANALTLNRKTGDVAAHGDVKTTYNVGKPDASGAMFASGDAIHVTSQEMSASRGTGRAHFAGGSRLWQAANIVEAPQIDFDRNGRILQASTGNQPNARVQTVFVQTDKTGKQTPITVTAERLTYSDGTRRARFEGGVIARSADSTLHADQVDITLRPKTSTKQQSDPNQPAAASQVDTIVAEGNIKIEQQNPVRQAKGDRLVYTAAEAKFVLTGSAENPPSIFDAERGNLTGDSLTFYSRNDTVQVGSKGSSRTVTHTRISSEKRP